MKSSIHQSDSRIVKNLNCFTAYRFAEDAKLDNDDVSSLQLTSSSGKSLGKIRGVIGQYGIGLIRIEDALSSTNLKIQNIDVNIEKPFWWPKEVSKEKLTRQ